MSSKPISAASPDPHAGGAPHRQDLPPRSARQTGKDSADPEADLRLIIEADPHSGDGEGAVYKVVDRRTGRIVHQLDRDEVLRLKDRTGYAAGDLFKGKA